MFKPMKKLTYLILATTLITPVVAMSISCSDKFDMRVPSSKKVYEWKTTDVYSEGHAKAGQLKKEALIRIRDEGFDGFTNKDRHGDAILHPGNIDENNFWGEVGTSTTTGFWSYFTNSNQIAPYAFWGMGLSSIPSIPSWIISIHEYAFYDNRIKSLSFDGHEKSNETQLRYIGAKAFAENEIASFPSSALMPANLPVNLLEIGEGAFASNKISSYLYLPDSLNKIGQRAFFGNRINRLYLGANLQTIDSEAFDQEPEELTAIYRVKVKNPNTKFMGITRDNPCYDEALKGVFNEKWTGFTWGASEVVPYETPTGTIEYKTKDEGRYNIAYSLNPNVRFDNWW